MAMYLFPCVMRKGIISQTNKTSAAAAAKIWANGTQPSDDTKGFLALAKAANPGTVYVGSSSVTTTNGLPLAASDQMAGAIDGPGAKEVWFVAADALQTLLVLEVG